MSISRDTADSRMVLLITVQTASGRAYGQQQDGKRVMSIFSFSERKGSGPGKVKAKGDGKSRIEIKARQSALNNLEALRVITDMATFEELFRHASFQFETLLTEIHAGGVTVWVNADGSVTENGLLSFRDDEGAPLGDGAGDGASDAQDGVLPLSYPTLFASGSESGPLTGRLQFVLTPSTLARTDRLKGLTNETEFKRVSLTALEVFNQAVRGAQDGRMLGVRRRTGIVIVHPVFAKPKQAAGAGVVPGEAGAGAAVDLSPLEREILILLQARGNSASTYTIRSTLASDPAITAVYEAANRLVEAGLVRIETEPGGPERNGWDKRVLHLTDDGVSVALAAYAAG